MRPKPALVASIQLSGWTIWKRGEHSYLMPVFEELFSKIATCTSRNDRLWGENTRNDQVVHRGGSINKTRVERILKQNTACQIHVKVYLLDSFESLNLYSTCFASPLYSSRTKTSYVNCITFSKAVLTPSLRANSERPFVQYFP